MSQSDELIRWWTSVESGLLLSARRRYGFDLETARDVVQDTAVLVLQTYAKAAKDKSGKVYPQFLAEEAFRPWVHARLHWIILDRLRSTKPFVAIDQASERSVSPSQEQALMVEDILRLIGDFPEKQRIALRGLIADKGTHTIAKELKVEESTVRSLQRHARMRLAVRLAKLGTRK